MALFRSLLPLLLAGTLPVSATAAERVQIRMGEPLARFDRLHAGTNTYLRHWIKADGTLEMIDLETKEVRFETENGQRRVHIVQHWTTPKVSLTIDSLFEDKTLRPITHQRITTKEGKTTRAGYRFLADKVVGLADLPENTQKDFEIATPVPAFNFEVDLETFATLPLRRNAEFEINFYHPGGEPPAPYVYKVAGEEKLFMAGKAIDCWVLTNDFEQPGQPHIRTRFWIAKDSQTVIRVHAALPDGSAVVKALLSSTTL